MADELAWRAWNIRMKAEGVLVAAGWLYQDSYAREPVFRLYLTGAFPIHMKIHLTA